jgi:hypothetical protein
MTTRAKRPSFPPVGSLGLLAALALLLASCGGGGSKGSSTPSGTNPPPPPPPTDPNPPPPTTEPVHFFGAQAHFGQGWSVDLVPRLTAGGMADVRDELYWQIVEPAAGSFRFPANYDAYMSALRNAGISPLITLSFENTAYDGGQTPYTTAGFEGYARYATEVLRHYGTQITAVEIWNEYNGTFAKGPATLDRAGTYLKMLRAAYAAIKAERPDVTVVAGATAGVPLPYFEKLFAAGALGSLDVVSVHPYRTASPPEGIEVQIAALQSLMAKYGAVKPIWVTELGWPLHASAAPGDLAVDEDVQAQFLVRSFALLASAGVTHVYWYELRDDTTDPDMGLVLNTAGYPARRAHAAMRTLNAQLRTARFAAREQTAAGVYSLRFTPPSGRELRVLWSLSPLSVPIPSGTTVTDLVGNAVTPASGSITVAGSPVYVSGPLPGLPGASTARAAAAITESTAAFSLRQGDFGWSYGTFTGAETAFVPLTQTRVTDWKEEWVAASGPLSLTNVDQHPSRTGSQAVSAVRRWTSTVEGDVRVTVRFKIGLQGDGVRVRVLADGQVLRTATLSRSTSIVDESTFTRFVRVGTTLDFAVDPGPANDLDFDVTQVSISIERAN